MIKFEINECVACNTLAWCRPHGARWVCQPCHGLAFFEKVLLPPFGFRALPWQQDLIRRSLTLDFESGEPLYRTVYCEVPKKNAKSFTAAFFPLYRLVFPMQVGALCFGAASSRDQATIVYETAQAMVEQSPLLRPEIKIIDSTRRMLHRKNGAVYRVISADGDIWDGIRPAIAVKDEIHRWKTAKAVALHHAINKGVIADPWAQVIEITTAGDPQSSPIWQQQRLRAELALARPGSDKRFLPILYRADPEKVAADPNYWTTREARAEANPSHEDNGGFLRDSAILEQLADGESAFKRFHLNLPSQENDRLIPLDKWHACRAPLRAFTGRPFVAGFDLSAVKDFTALALLYPDSDETLDLKLYCYVPEQGLAQLERITHQPLRDWVASGDLIACPGDTIDYDFILQQLQAARELSRAHQVGYDRRFADDLVKRLKKDRFLVEPIDQGYNGMTGAIQALEKLVAERRIRHEGNRCMDWMIACTTVKVSDDGGRKPDKSGERATKADRIDGVSATLTALATMSKYPVKTSGYAKGLVWG